MTFPSDLEKIQTISFQAYESPDFVQNLIDYEDAVKSGALVGGLIQLPLPASLEDNLSHTWNINHGAGNGQYAAIGADVSNKLISNVSNTAGTIIDKAAEMGGGHFDPNYFYSYVETRPREFSYSINIIPKNSSESGEISKIIKHFKKYSSPTTKNTMVSTFVWKMTLGNSLLSDSMKLGEKRWALSSVNTNYTGAGSSLFFEDGYSKQINLSLVFQEITTMYSKDWGE